MNKKIKEFFERFDGKVTQCSDGTYVGMYGTTLVYSNENEFSIDDAIRLHFSYDWQSNLVCDECGNYLLGYEEQCMADMLIDHFYDFYMLGWTYEKSMDYVEEWNHQEDESHDKCRICGSEIIEE